VFAFSASAQQVPLAQHVILVIEENTSYHTAVGPPPAMPWLVSQGKIYGYASNYYSNASGSLLDYLWLASGSSELSFGCNGNQCSAPITDDNIFRLLNDAPMSWKVYAQNYLNAGGTVTTPDSARGTHYYRRHNAAVWYSDILNNTLGSQGAIVDLEQFLIDDAQGALPRFSIIIPDGNYDAHDGTPETADTFLANNLAPILAQPDFLPGGSGLLIVTFDNGDNDAQGQIYTAFLGPNVKPASVTSKYYQHQNTLRTILDALAIQTYPGGAGSAADISDLFSSAAGSVVVDSPANQSMQGISVAVRAAASELASPIDHMEIWDNGKKLGNVFSSIVEENFSLAAGAHVMTVEDIGPAPKYAALHQHTVAFTVTSGNGVFLSMPANNSLQAPLFPVSAYAVESGGEVDHLEVWADGKKLGDSPKGSTLSQWYNSLSTGSHQLTVEDVNGDGAALHSATVNITVSSSNNVFVNAPAPNSTQSGAVQVNAYAYEQNHSSQQVDHLEVWDNGLKLGNSPVGYAVTGLFINQSYALKSGPHQMIIEDIGPGPGFSVVHKAIVNFTVQ
jgi:hypothetical protein